ncbi:helix-turn-helix domain-containing protein [Micromonospora echinospora]
MSAPHAGRFADLHPDDATARRALIGELRQLRIDAGLTHRAVARLMGWRSPNGALSNIERSDNWRLRTLQALARLYGRQLHVDVGAPLPDDGDPLAAMYAVMRPTSPAAADELARAVLVHDLARIRAASGRTHDDLGAAIGVTPTAVHLWEQGADGVMVAPAQRYGRAIAAPLTFRLTPVGPTSGAGTSPPGRGARAGEAGYCACTHRAPSTSATAGASEAPPTGPFRPLYEPQAPAP